MEKKYHFLKHLCDRFHIEITYDDPITEVEYKEAIYDLEETLKMKGHIRVNPENGHIMVRKFGGNTFSNRKTYPPREKIVNVN